MIGVHFASINNRISENNRTQLNELINKEITTFLERIKIDEKNNTTITIFNDKNMADNLKEPNQQINCFTNTT